MDELFAAISHYVISDEDAGAASAGELQTSPHNTARQPVASPSVKSRLSEKEVVEIGTYMFRFFVENFDGMFLVRIVSFLFHLLTFLL